MSHKLMQNVANLFGLLKDSACFLAKMTWMALLLTMWGLIKILVFALNIKDVYSVRRAARTRKILIEPVAAQSRKILIEPI